MISTLLASSALIVSLGGTPVPFGPGICPYTLNFPGTPTQSETPSPDGSKIVAAELLTGSTRLSAFCAVSPATSGIAVPLDEPARRQRVAELVNGLGIADYKITDDVASGCSDVDGRLAANATTYRIVSRLCFRADSTFIAEAVFGSPADARMADDFIASIRPAKSAGAQQSAP